MSSIKFRPFQTCTEEASPSVQLMRLDHGCRGGIIRISMEAFQENFSWVPDPLLSLVCQLAKAIKFPILEASIHVNFRY